MKGRKEKPVTGEDTASVIRAVCEQVLEKITPSASDRRELRQFSEAFVKTVRDSLQRAKIDADVHIQGSIAKDTWIAGEKEIDLFISLSKTTSRDALPKVLDVVKGVLGDTWVEAYAEHPYLIAEVDGYKIDIVPCFPMARAGQTITAVDRTPLHTAYVKDHLDDRGRQEVRLLKKFMSGIGVYGAEIKVHGFSGYLCELLILTYTSFVETLRHASEWKLGEIIDLEHAYEGRLREAQRRFNAPLIVIDPVDRNRNVAAAVSTERLGELRTASRRFLDRPRLALFYPPPTRRPSAAQLRETVSRLGFDVIAVVFQDAGIVPDVLWGQLYKSLRSIRSLLVQHDFHVLKTSAWSDGKASHAFLLALESRIIPATKRHQGPPFYAREADHFLEKHLDADTTAIGPWIEGDRWIVGVQRRYTDAAVLLRDELKKEEGEAGVARNLLNAIKPSLEITVNEEIIERYGSDAAFIQSLLAFLSGRPKWLE